VTADAIEGAATNDRRVDAVLVSYRSGDRLVAAVDALRQDRSIGRIVVVDHGDGSDAARAAELGAVVRHDASNPGFGSGQNAGVAMTDAPFVLLINPDAVLEGGAIAAGLAVLDREDDVAAVQGVVRGHEDGRPERSHGQELGPVHLWGRALRLRRLLALRPVRALAARCPALRDHVEREPEGELAVESLAAVSILVRRRAFDSVGGFDERYFLYGEDVDLCHRLRLAGWRLLALPTAWSRHVGGASAASSTERELTWWRGTMRFGALWWDDGAWRRAVGAAVVRWIGLTCVAPRSARRAWRALVAEPCRDRRSFRSGKAAPWRALTDGAVTDVRAGAPRPPGVAA
jgi:N-acetylglucosaminyl-diphospho-decaprenol L-rhamnosyltransferase